MCRALADGSGTVVAGATGAENLAMIDGRRGSENCRGVAIFANVRRLHMRRVLAGRIRAVMAANTVVGNTRMIENYLRPADRVVAVIAGVTTGNMRRMLAGGNNAIVTGTAIAYHLCVINS